MAPPSLTGRWSLRRTGGLLPPLGLLHKRIEGRRGATRLGPVGLPFRVRAGPRGPELAYIGPLRLLTDRLRPDGSGGWEGEAVLAGVRIGRFRMVPGEDVGAGRQSSSPAPRRMASESE